MLYKGEKMELKGKIVQIISAVVDVHFENGVPDIYAACKVKNGDNFLTLEVAQDLGDGMVKCIAMGPTDGLSRGLLQVRINQLKFQ